MLINALDRHDHIAYDLDGTLFGLRGNILATYIVNHPEKNHSIVTSRQSGFTSISISQLKSMLGEELPFKHIIHSSSPTHEGHQVNLHFKGIECKRIGATVLIDDWVVHQPGCIANNIEFIDVNNIDS